MRIWLNNYGGDEEIPNDYTLKDPEVVYERFADYTGWPLENGAFEFLGENIFESGILDELKNPYDNLGNVFQIAKNLEKYRQKQIFGR
ncbi:MAG TPA: hypothetical protein DEP51_06660 [Clostridiales bacterium]|nr:hypothetical protein [Clostridiales bacterium]